MELDYAKPGYTDEAAPFIEEHGGKVGGCQFIKAKDPELGELVPDTVIIPPDKDEVNKIPFDTDVIVRASHKGDFDGLVDALETEVVESGPGMLDRINRAIQFIREKCKSREVMEYGRYENPDFDGEVVVGIQPFFRFPVGSVMEHPNQPGHYIISHVLDGGSVPGLGKIPDNHGSKLFDSDRKELDSYAPFHDTNKPRRIIDVYRRIQGLGLLRDGLVPQVEFGDEEGGDGLKIFQIRAGARMELAKFTLDRWSHNIALALGVTEGIELPLFHSYWKDHGSFMREANDSKPPYAFMRTHHKDRMSLDFRPTNMAAYLANFSFGSGWPGLEHNQFSLIQKARVSVLERKYECAFRDLDKSGTDIDKRYREGPKIPDGKFTGDKVRIISDGIHALVELI